MIIAPGNQCRKNWNEVTAKTMHSHEEIFVIRSFPDFSVPGFDMDRYNNVFLENNVIINARSSNVRYDEHWGPLSLKFAFGGSEHYRIRNKILSVDDRRFLIVNDGSFYSSSIRSEQAVESFTMNFSPSFVRSVLSAHGQSDEDNIDAREPHGLPELRFEEHLYPHHPQLYRSVLLLRTMSLSSAMQKERILEVFHESLSVMMSMHRRIRNTIARMSPAKASTKRELYRRLCTARDYMYSCYDRPLTLSDVSKTACLAPAYFLRQFKKHFGVTPHHYLTERRLEKAADLLRSKSYSVTDACITVGFEDVSSFSKLFKKKFGMPPSHAVTLL